jgi:hypothetical protein
LENETGVIHAFYGQRGLSFEPGEQWDKDLQRPGRGKRKLYVHAIGREDVCGDKDGFAMMMTYRPLQEAECTYMKHHKNFQDDESISWQALAKSD